MCIALLEAVEKHNRLYFDLGQPEITDKEYDAMVKELKPEEVESLGVGGSAGNALHDVPMLSLNKVYSTMALKHFDVLNRLAVGGPVGYTVEPKIDGVALSLRYDDGILVRAATRGNGRSGKDVTNNALVACAEIPTFIAGAPPRLEIRGEIFMGKHQFAMLNEQLTERGLPVLQSPRAATAGTLQMRKMTDAARRSLRFIAYEIVEGMELASQLDVVDALNRRRFQTDPNMRLLAGFERVIDVCALMSREVPALDYPCDGLVVKVASIAHRKMIGSNQRAPKWAVAWKF